MQRTPAIPVKTIVLAPPMAATMQNVAGLTIGDLVMEQGYHIAVIRHDKGNKRGLAKLPVKVRRAIDDYLEAVGQACAAPEAPLFISFRKGNHPQERPLHPNQVERIVKQRTQAVGIAMSPHAMRASFITLAFEGGADLALVQDGARHKDPRITRRYQKRRKSLHKNAVDFVWID